MEKQKVKTGRLGPLPRAAQLPRYPTEGPLSTPSLPVFFPFFPSGSLVLGIRRARVPFRMHHRPAPHLHNGVIIPKPWSGEKKKHSDLAPGPGLCRGRHLPAINHRCSGHLVSCTTHLMALTCAELSALIQGLVLPPNGSTGFTSVAARL